MEAVRHVLQGAIDRLQAALASPSGAEEQARLAALAVVALAGAVLLANFALGALRFLRRERVLAPIPSAPGSNLLLGHALAMLNAPKHGKGAWDLIEEWAAVKGNICRFRILGTHAVVVADPGALKRVFQTKFKSYSKDLRLSYHPFLPILGTGLVTADGDLWQKQRLLMAPALRVDILDDIIPIAKRAVDRLAGKLEGLRGGGATVHLEEEFRLLTLQVIGEAILSLPPEECGRVFPQLYLPVMEEANRRVLLPHRKYLPTAEWFRFRRNMKALNAYLVGLIRGRWQARLAGERPARDILDRILAALEASGTKWDAAIETQLCYEVKTFLLAGHETSAAMLMWSCFELSQNEAARQKVAAEAEEAFGADNHTPSRRAADNMPYTLSVLKEALRNHQVLCGAGGDARAAGGRRARRLQGAGGHHDHMPAAERAQPVARPDDLPPRALHAGRRV
ncbi:MAG: cytochrome P450 [Monoraphidium minutum]|nr:MAG: cytochrome P450 [Monoraphidium minutum]